jgi:hypothetical protein
MTKNEFVEWKSLYATKEVFKTIRDRQQAIKDELAVSAGIDPAYDRYRVGAIQAYEDFLGIDYEGTE